MTKKIVNLTEVKDQAPSLKEVLADALDNKFTDAKVNYAIVLADVKADGEDALYIYQKSKDYPVTKALGLLELAKDDVKIYFYSMDDDK